MDAAANAAEIIGGIIGLVLFWGIVLFVIPMGIALYASRLFPLTGQWRKRWTEWRQRR